LNRIFKTNSIAQGGDLKSCFLLITRTDQANHMISILIQIQHDVEDDDKWVDCLDHYGVELPTGYYLGFTSQTGDLSG